MQFEDMIIEASDATRALDRSTKAWQVSFLSRVTASPAGAHDPDTRATVTYQTASLAEQIGQLERRTLDQAGLITLGRALAAILLPTTPAATSIYELFVRSLALAGANGGLRLRLRLPPLLAVLPWEYLYIDRAGNPESIDGFVALNPRVAIVREEVQPTPAALAPHNGPIKVVAAFASPEGAAPLNLAQEQANLRAALDGQAGIEAAYLEQATLDELLTAIHMADIFHFAGHGQFARQPQDAPGVYTGEGGILLFDQYVNAEQLAVNLGRGGVRLAVLAACETGRRDETSVWSGVAPALVRSQAQVPAVIANQLTISDAGAIAFSKHLYQALIGGLSVEEAVAAGRIGAYNAEPDGRDWGVAVLYLRQGDGALFAGADDSAVRETARQGAEVVVNVRIERVDAGGYVAGAEVGTLRRGTLNVVVELGQDSGNALGADIDHAEGGKAHIDVSADELNQDGRVTGVRIDDI